MRKLNYPVVVSCLAFLAVLLVTFSQYNRVLEPHRELYLYLRVFYGIVALGYVLYFMFKPISDLSATIFCIHLISYCVAMMWFMPLYEAAYFQCAIGSAFLRFKRGWIQPLICFFGLVGILTTYHLQDQWQWKMPEATRDDWISVVVIFFLLTLAIQKFAISTYRKDADSLRRFGVIGRDAARLTHDLKGLLSSPMLLLESFRDKTITLPPDFYERQMSLLIKDMDHVRETIKGINRLAVVDETLHLVDINKTLTSVLDLLARRLAKVHVALPESRQVMANSERLHSIFFNLLINSIQAFEGAEVSGPARLEIFWDKNSLVFKDNAGGMKNSVSAPKAESSGLGLELIHRDVQVLGAEFHISSEAGHTIAKIKFKRNAIR